VWDVVTTPSLGCATQPTAPDRSPDDALDGLGQCGKEMVNVEVDTVADPIGAVSMRRRARGMVALTGVAIVTVAAAVGVMVVREAESTANDENALAALGSRGIATATPVGPPVTSNERLPASAGESTPAVGEPVAAVQAASAPPAGSTPPVDELATASRSDRRERVAPDSVAPETTVPGTTTPTTTPATTVPGTTTPTTVPATTVPQTTSPTTVPATIVPADPRGVTIHQRVESCRFGSRCLVVGFTIDGFDDHPGTFVCEFGSGRRYTISFTATTVHYACATANASDSITIEIDGVRSSTIDSA
jgi:hypothetical protein